MLSRSPARSLKPDWEGTWLSILAVLAALLLYGNLATKELLYDSLFVVGNDPRLKSFTGENIWFIFTRDYWWPALPSNLYRPVTTFSFLMEYTVFGFGADPSGYQRVNLLLHCLNLILIVNLMGRIGIGPWVRLILALWIAVHPYGTEVITNIVGRSDLLAAFFTFLAIWFWERSRDGGHALRRWGVLIFFSLFLGALSKEIGLMGGPILGLWIWFRTPDCKNPLALAFAKGNRAVPLAFLAGFIVLLLSRIFFKTAIESEQITFIDNALQGTDAVRARLSAAQIAWTGFKDLLFPYGLAADYSFAQIVPLTERSSGLQHGIAGFWLFATAATGIAALYLTWKRHLPGMLVLMGGIAFAPTSNLLILIGSIRADRFWYFPLLFLIPAIVLMAAQVLPAQLERLRAPVRGALAGLLALYLVSLCALTLARNAEWTTETRFWKGMVLDSPNSMRAKNSAAGLIAEHAGSEAEFKEAERLLDEVVALEKYHQLTPLQRPSRLTETRARIYAVWGEWLDEEKQPERAKEMRLKALGYFRSAVEEFERGAEAPYSTKKETEFLFRRHLSPLTDLCKVLLIEKQYAEIIERLTKALSQDPTNPNWLKLIGEAYSEQGMHREAVRYLLLSVFLAEAPTTDVTNLAKSIQALHAKSQPVAEQVDGRITRLNLSDPIVRYYITHYGALALRLSRENDGPRVSADMRRFMKFQMGITIREHTGETTGTPDPLEVENAALNGGAQ